MSVPGPIVVTGATGRQGRAVTRALLADGWPVRALTRDPTSEAARALATAGAELVAGDMAEPSSLHEAFDGAHGVYSVQNPVPYAFSDEVEQGTNVVIAAVGSGVGHLVYASAGPGVHGTGVEHFEAKAVVVDRAHRVGIPLTVLRPMAFMELMTDKEFYPPVSLWHLMPKLVGEDTPLPWLSVDDLGSVAARVFAEPETYVGSDLALGSDVRTLGECRETWRQVTGHRPRRFPMPEWLFRRVADPDLLRMWRWLATADLEVDVAATRAIVPGAATIESFVERQHGSS